MGPLTGFCISGSVAAFLGAMLPAWGFHLEADLRLAAAYFVALAMGMIAAAPVAMVTFERRRSAVRLAAGSAVIAVGFCALAVTGPFPSTPGRFGGMLLLGLGAGLLNTANFHAISTAYRSAPLPMLTLVGTFYGFGSLATVLLVAGTFYLYPVAGILLILGALTGAASLVLARLKSADPVEGPAFPFRRALASFAGWPAVFLSVLLFVQFSNEWSLAGWVPIYLIRQLGASPEYSIFLLACFWTALVTGRVAAQEFLKRVVHARLLAISVGGALFGYSILALTTNGFGAAVALILIGGAYALIYPLVVEKIGAHFPGYHPGLFNGIFSLGSVGGLLAPAAIGCAAQAWGLRAIVMIPLAGTCLSFLLLLLIWLISALGGAPVSRGRSTAA